MKKLQKLPIGIQTFRKIVEGDYLYIDKTKIALELIENNEYIFLSRPRRFGKSLFLDTLHNIFEGNKELFKGLHIYDKYDFKKYPVIKIDWAGDFTTEKGTEKTLRYILEENQIKLGIDCLEYDSPSSCFARLIKKSYEKHGEKVVILIDEYDKPILDAIGNKELAEKNRKLLRSIYLMMKSNDQYIKFVFLTGITKFSKASIFSGLNNLDDISLDEKYGDICGYTQKDIETKFVPHLEGVDLQKLKEWYNGYNFLGSKVYNPFDILLFISKNHKFDNYWFDTATPNFLIEVLKEKEYFIPKLENLVVGKEIVNSFDINKIKLETLLLQAGYLTIDKRMESPFGGVKYSLRVPNKEVQMSLNNLFLDYLTEDIDIERKEGVYLDLLDGKLEDLEKKLKTIFSSIPYNNYTNNKIYEYEGYYASVIYTYLASLGIKIIAEDVTNLGRIDLTIFVGDRIYILEFKVVKKQLVISNEQLVIEKEEFKNKEEQENVGVIHELPTGVENINSALEQIKAKKYSEKYVEEGKEIILLGIEFSKEEKNICSFDYAQLP
jgi:hypothetical protein